MFVIFAAALMPLPIFGFTLTHLAESGCFRLNQSMLSLLLLLVWVSAAMIASFIGNWLLIRPLRELRSAIADHIHGTPFTIPPLKTPVHEICALAAEFSRLGEQMDDHKEKLATALADQTRSTREVHHRVKNNLQVIASLISLHARRAEAPDAITAYASIQRRVDALAIVHRNHYAELDSDVGIDIKGLLGELASNLRVGAAPGTTAPSMTIVAPRIGISQDCAVAISFLLTELIELSTTLDPTAAIEIEVSDCLIADKATLSISSRGLKATPRMATEVAGRYARVLEGLARQLRAPLQHDGEQGQFSIDFAVLDYGQKN